MQEYNANKIKTGLGIVLAALTWLLMPVAHAQSDAAILASVRACQSITGLSERLACYDRVLPPGTGTVGAIGTAGAVGTAGTAGASRRTETIERGNSELSREQELEATVAELEQQLERETADTGSTGPTARIVEVQRPSLRTSRLIAADGRVFVESVTTSIIRWPDTPFDVEVNRSITGTYTIRAVGTANDRGLGRGYRVALER